MEFKPIIKGVASYLPGLYDWNSRRRTLKTATAEYCYETWLHHIILLDSSERFPIPHTVAELGPGGSLGVGLAAILSGASTYYALDVVKYSESDSNLGLLDDLIQLFRDRTPVDIGAYAELSGWPTGSSIGFPHHILSDELLIESLADSRIAEIRRAISAADGRSGSITIEYTVPWSDPAVIRNGEVDLIVSKSVLEHVNDLEDTYDAFAQWLRPGGRMSHSVDFRSHFDTKAWNSHWQYSEPVWRVVVGKKPFLINRQPCSKHVSDMKARGFELTLELRQRLQGLPSSNLASRWQGMSEDDVTCVEAMLQARLVDREDSS